jgi:hypothetical protein
MKHVIVILILTIASCILYLYYIKKESYAKSNQCNVFSDDDMITLLRKIAKYVRPDLNCKITLFKGSRSQTISKRHIELCIRDDQNVMYPLHTLIYVLLHEMSHVMSSTYSGYETKAHDPIFFANFEKLLLLAKSKGIRVNESDVPVNYCSI